MEIKYTTKYNIGDEVWVKHYADQIPLINMLGSERTYKKIISKVKILAIDLHINEKGEMEESYFVDKCYKCCYIANTIEESFDFEYAILREDQIEEVINFHKKELDVDVEWIK